MFFLISKHISDLRHLTKKKSRLNNKRRRSRFRKQQLQQPTQPPQFLLHNRHKDLHTRSPHKTLLCCSHCHTYTHAPNSTPTSSTLPNPFLLLFGSVAFWLLLIRLLQWWSSRGRWLDNSSCFLPLRGRNLTAEGLL